MLAELDLSKYATKADVKNTTSVDTSEFHKNLDLASLKSETDKLDIVKLESRNFSSFKSAKSCSKKTKLLKRLHMLNKSRKLMQFKLLILVI